jgi:hypothetical protein
MKRMSRAETVVGLPWAADSCPWVGKLRTVLPLSDVIRDGVVQLVLAHQSARKWDIRRAESTLMGN